MKIYIVVFAIMMWFCSCTKGPGEGGRAFIKGKIFIKNYTAPPCPCSFQGEYYAQGENVYIVYGSDPGVGKTVKTSFDGSFQFDYLRKGKYKVFALSDDTTSTLNSKSLEKIVEVEIKSASETITIPDIVIIK